MCLFIHPQPNPDSFTWCFNNISTGLEAYYDEVELVDNLPPVNIDWFHVKGYQGVFGRIVEDTKGSFKCYQYLFVWDRQYLPPHPMDYSPVLVFEQKGEKTVLYDRLHYLIGKGGWNKAKSGFRILFPWRSLRQKKYTSIEPALEPLTDDHIDYWTKLDGHAKLKLEECLSSPIPLLDSESFCKMDFTSRCISSALNLFSGILPSLDIVSTALEFLLKATVYPLRELTAPDYKSAIGTIQLVDRCVEFDMLGLDKKIKHETTIRLRKIDEATTEEEVIEASDDLIDLWMREDPTLYDAHEWVSPSIRLSLGVSHEYDFLPTEIGPALDDSSRIQYKKEVGGYLYEFARPALDELLKYLSELKMKKEYESTILELQKHSQYLEGLKPK